MAVTAKKLFDDWWSDFERPQNLLDKHFGMDATQKTVTLPPFEDYVEPWKSFLDQTGGNCKVDCNKSKHEVTIDVQQFLPSEIIVKTIGNTVVVEAKHEENCEVHGNITREFVRRYTLPEDHDITQVQCRLSAGVLTISVPKIPKIPPGERIIPIEQTCSAGTKLCCKQKC